MIDWTTTTTILGVIVIVMPVVFGSLAWKLLAIFLPRSEFVAFQTTIYHKLNEIKCDMKDELDEIKQDVKSILRHGGNR